MHLKIKHFPFIFKNSDFKDEDEDEKSTLDRLYKLFDKKEKN